MIQFETEVTEVIKRTKNVKSFRFTAKENVDFKPGQFFFVGIKIDGAERTKHFSFSNSPTEKGYIEFTKRLTGSDFSNALDRLKKDDRAKIKMPLGTFTFEGEYEKIAFLSGGIGITPIRSICKFAADKGLKTDMALLYGNNTEEDIIFREDLDNMQSQNKNLRVFHTLTSPGVNRNGWKGRTGYIDADMIRRDIPDFKDRVFYLCGPPAMVDSLKKAISDRLGVSPEKIKVENFSGY